MGMKGGENEKWNYPVVAPVNAANGERFEGSIGAAMEDRLVKWMQMTNATIHQTKLPLQSLRPIGMHFIVGAGSMQFIVWAGKPADAMNGDGVCQV